MTMNSDEIRGMFLRFFEERGHTIIPSSSLIPRGDPTLLLTNAGMVQFKPYFMGEATPPSPRLTSCQKCFRTTDIDSVGNFKHLTFFEMLGNFSVGDYFKQEAIEYAWEFVTQRLHLPPKRLWTTIFLDDNEAWECWRKVGVPVERIARYGEKDNFWGPAGETGPCGPCSEIHYDFGEEYGCGKPSCGPACDCQRFIEIWNLVFMQYYQDAEGKRTPLPKKNIDTGMGLERVTALMQGKNSIYDTDLFAPLVQRVCDLAGHRYGSDEGRDRAVRVIVEHGRGVTFLIADGVIPSNEGRGYVLRRVLRRAVRFGKTLGIEAPFIVEVSKTIIVRMGHVYPELTKNERFVLQVVNQEEAKFDQTLEVGLNLLEGIIEEVRKRKERIILGKEVFRLYDTYGFPEELTREVAAEHGLSIDTGGFQHIMNRQREKARAAQRFGLGEKVGMEVYQELGLPTTNFVGYDKTLLKTLVISLLVKGQPADKVDEGQECEMILSETPFYGEAGGQVGDTGEIRSDGGKFLVTDTVKPLPELIVHRGKVVQGHVSVGDEVEAAVDFSRRLDIARNHTATHLLQAALRQVLGTHVHQSGSLVAPDRLRFDFSHLTTITKEELAEVQRIVNERVRQNLPVTTETMPYAEAIKAGAIALFDEKYGEKVRVVRVGEAPSVFSAELCGGTHVTRTGDIGLFLVVAESGIGAGMRRIEAVTGRGGESYVEGRFGVLERAARLLKAHPTELEEKMLSLLSDLEAERKRLTVLQRGLAKGEVESLLAKVDSIDGVKVLAARVEAPNIETLREMGDWLKEKLGSAIIVLGAIYNDRPNFLAMVTPDLTAKGIHAGEIVKRVAAITGGGGGGRAELGQAGGKDKNKLDEALAQVRHFMQNRSNLG